MKNTGIVFIHGAGLGSYIWNDVTALVPYPVLAIDLPNRITKKANAGLTLDEYTASVIKNIQSWNADRFIIVAHSIGGCIGLKVASHFGKRVAGFIAISAAIPENGNSFVSVFSFPKRMMLFLMMRLFGTKPPAKTIQKDLCNGLTGIQAKQVVTNFTPESTHLYFDKCGVNIPFTETLYIKCSQDHSFAETLQDKMAKTLGAKKTAILQSGHLPMMSEPEQLANVITHFISCLP